MVSLNRPAESFGMETVALLLNIAVALSLSFSTMLPVFIVLGFVFGVVVFLRAAVKGVRRTSDLQDIRYPSLSSP